MATPYALPATASPAPEPQKIVVDGASKPLPSNNEPQRAEESLRLPPHLQGSVAQLKSAISALSCSLAAFHESAVDLHNHLVGINSAIFSKLPPEVQHFVTLPSSEPEAIGVVSGKKLPELANAIGNVAALPSSSHSEEAVTVVPEEKISCPTGEIQNLPTLASSSSPREAEAVVSEDEFSKLTPQFQNNSALSSRAPSSEVEHLCETMNSRGLRKYLVTKLNDVVELRKEVPKALTYAPNPAKLVLECSGRFFLQGKKAFTRNSPMIPAREASVLILEFFLLMMGISDKSGAVEFEKQVKEEAISAALAWRKRLITEGGISKASEIDARGLMLFVACFGIPREFKLEDIRDLAKASNAKGMKDVLWKSSVLMDKIPGVVERMVANKLEVDAVDMVYTFGFEDRFNPQKILVSFLQDSKLSMKKIKKASQGSSAATKEKKKNQLTALRSVVDCLESHKVDPSQLLPEWKLKQKISSIMKDMAALDKGKGEQVAQKRKGHETEVSKMFKGGDAKRSRSTGHGIKPLMGDAHIDCNRILPDVGLPSQATNYVLPSIAYESHAGTFRGNLSGSVQNAMLASGDILPGVTYAGVHGVAAVGSTGYITDHNSMPYSWPGDAALLERYSTHSYAGERPSVGLSSMYRPSIYPEEFVRLPGASSVGLSSRGSDLYQFADAVIERESHQSSIPRNISASSALPPPYRTSYLYSVDRRS